MPSRRKPEASPRTSQPSVFTSLNPARREFDTSVPGDTKPIEPGSRDLNVAYEQEGVPLPGSAPNGEIILPVEAALDFAPQARKRRHAYEPLRAPMEDIPEEPT